MPSPLASLRRWAFGSNRSKSTEIEARREAIQFQPSVPNTWTIGVVGGGSITRGHHPTISVSFQQANNHEGQPLPTETGPSQCEDKGKYPAIEDNNYKDDGDDDEKEEEVCPPPNTPTHVLTALFRSMDFYRLSPNSLSTMFRPKTRGQGSVLKYMRDEIEDLRQLLRDHDREARLATGCAPQDAGTDATLRWLDNPGPQSVAELLAARDAAEKKARESKKGSWSWSLSPVTPTSGGFAGPSLPRKSGENTFSVSGDAPMASTTSLGRFSDEIANRQSIDPCNIGRPGAPSVDLLHSLLRQVALERAEIEKRETKLRPKFERMGGWYNAPIWPKCPPRPPTPPPTAPCPVEENADGDDDGESVDSVILDENLEDQDFYDEIYDLDDSSCQVAEEVQFQRATMVHINDQGLPSSSPMSSDGSSVYDGEQQDDRSDNEDEASWRRHRRTSQVYSPGEFWHAPETSEATAPTRPVAETPPYETGLDEYGDDFFLHKDPQGGQRLVKRLVLQPPYYYPYYTSDGQARVNELRGLLSCPPNYKAADIILTLLRYKPETRAFMAKKVPGVARRANQINWGGVMEDMTRKEDKVLYFQWEERDEPVFQINDENESHEATETDEIVHAPLTSKVLHYMSWKKPGKSRLSEADSSES